MKDMPASAMGRAAADAAGAFGSSVGEVWKAMSGLALPLPALSRVQQDYLQQATALWNQTVAGLSAGGADEAPPRALGGQKIFPPKNGTGTTPKSQFP